MLSFIYLCTGGAKIHTDNNTACVYYFMYKQVMCRGGNKVCVMCGGRNPTWGCFPFGVLCCTKCAGVFRDMGTSVCMVKSLLLDSVDDEFMAPFIKGGNSLFTEWYEQNITEELVPEFFTSLKAKEYLLFLSSERDKQEDQPTLKAPVVQTPHRRHQSKLKMSFASPSTAQTQGVTDKNNFYTEKEKISTQSEKEEQPAEIRRVKKSVKRSSGKIIADEQDSSRLGMFRNVQEVSNASVPAIKTGSILGSTSTQSIPSQEIIVGRTFIGSADIPQETVADKIKKGIKKGKKTLLNTIEKAQKKYSSQ